MISTDQLDFKKHISLTGELVGIVILRRCSSLRGRLEEQGRISIRGRAGFSRVHHRRTKQDDVGFCRIHGLSQDSGNGVVNNIVVIVQRGRTDGRNCPKSVQGHEQSTQNGHPTHVESLSRTHKLDKNPDKSVNLFKTMHCQLSVKYVGFIVLF